MADIEKYSPQYHKQFKNYVADTLDFAISKGYVSQTEIENILARGGFTEAKMSERSILFAECQPEYTEEVAFARFRFLNIVVATIERNINFRVRRIDKAWTPRDLLDHPDFAVVFLLYRAIRLCMVPSIIAAEGRRNKRFDFDTFVAMPCLELGLLATIIGISSNNAGRFVLSSQVVQRAGSESGRVSRESADKAWRNDAKSIKRLAGEGFGATAIAKQLGVGRASVYRALEEAA